ncbi:hypothetical protein SAMN04487910_4423 [Aquimarina amphilecti]|uniref:Lipoprotein n=1 Tax=Aquimarina amphilecti TaxID=1038014 RepID=A0A1H7WG18_AQUAM|nr:hypothetical protein [Aquimarina amphilecti]SEM20304.1 hypothetical protein SAMN04487910_4423 [Aquimarina amphilecti]
MKKIVSILLISTLLFLFQNCSYDELEVFDENPKLTEEFNVKMGSNTSDSDPFIEGCEIEYTFSNPNLTPSEKSIIRNSYSFYIGIKSVNGNTEIWYTDCSDFNDYNNLNPGCDIYGCYIETSGCPSGGCGSTPPDDPIEDPFGSNE